MISTSRLPVLKSILLLFCVFYFAMLCLTWFAIVYSAYEINPTVFSKTGTVNYCKQVNIPVNGCKGSSMFMHAGLCHIP